MSAQEPQDQQLDASVRPASGTGPAAPTPSVRDLLAACAAARTVSTPPDDPAPVERPHEEPAHHGSGRDAA